MISFRYIIVNTLHKGYNKDNNVKKRLCAEILGIWSVKNMVTLPIIVTTGGYKKKFPL
jgi:hypothetical protein